MLSFTKLIAVLLMLFISVSDVGVTAFVATTPRQQDGCRTKSHVKIALPTVMTPSPVSSSSMTRYSRTSISLNERKWNFNEGQGPFGLKRNAETWNGRVAQMAFVFVFLQELILGKGVVQGITDGDTIYIACLVLFFASVGGLTIFLASKGADNYVDESLGRK